MKSQAGGSEPGEENSWVELTDWWLAELEGDPTYEELVTPLVKELTPVTDRPVVDLGCGEGRLMGALREMGNEAVGVDIDRGLLRRARAQGPVVRTELPQLSALSSGVFGGALVCLVMEHIAEHRTLICEAARVVVEGGFLVVVINHPIFTAPESGPIVDSDGEMLWRPGEYFGSGWTDEPAGAGIVRFHHRPMSELLNAAAECGWSLDRLVEVGVTEQQIRRTPWLEDQRNIPRLMGARWTNASGR
ncbi:MAG: class I SAM-dependent DNA methyltransferase [Acidimicrobiia bacterium]